ncbi:hypothetical protein DH2020_045127 [Rehmannia glutinosa]|uniref:RING-type domain-containing protein n=1 Tax=Rehmannia glutinosa TaxID=99300 RepID=A0ABR0UFN7_REHGL
MGLGDADLLDDGGGGGVAEAAVAVACSICLEVVTDNGDRSWAKLQCGHQFHLDCIGSAFNIKGAMQCPNCRKIEKGQWLYANGSRPLPEFSMEDWAHDEDLYDLSYSEMCLQTSVKEALGKGITGNPFCWRVHFASSGSVSDGSTFNNHWNGPSVPSEVPNSYAFPSMDLHYHNWDHSSPFATNNRIGGADQPLISSVAQRTSRTAPISQGMECIPSFSVIGDSASRAPTSITSSVLPPYPGGTVARPRDRPSSLQSYFQQSTTNPSARAPPISTGRRSNSHRGLAQVAPIASSSDQSGGFYFFSSNSSGRTFQEAENPHHRDHFHHWEREHQPSESIWGPFPPPAAGSESGIRNFRQRHGSERMPSQNRS